MLATPAFAATGVVSSGSSHATGGPASAVARLPLSARQMLADQHLHAQAAHVTGSVTGVALAPDGQPLAGVCVDAYGPSGERLGVTSEAGRYFIPGLRLGAYHLRYSSCDSATRYLPEWYGGAANRVSSSLVQVSQTTMQPLASVTLRTAAEESITRNVVNTSSPAATASSLATALGLPSAGARPLTETTAARAHNGRIAGRVTGQNGKPLKGICVEAVDTSRFAFAIAVTGANGQYRTSLTAAGTYEVAFFAQCGNKGNWRAQIYKDSYSKPTNVRVAAGKTTNGINAVLKLGGEISGVVTGTGGSKLSGICVDPIKSGNAPYFDALSSRGTYHLRGMPAGTYRINFSPCGPSSSAYAPVWWDNTQSHAKAKPVRLKGTQRIGGINEVMPLGGVITGTVTDASVQPKPLSGICVYVIPAGEQGTGGGFFGGGGPGQPATNSAGQYKIDGLTAGSYQLQFDTGCNNNGNYLPATSSTINVQLGGTYPGVDATMQPGATISGKVTSAATGAPLGGICVSVWGGPDSYFGGGVSTRSDGTYVVNNQVPPGTYYVDFSGGCGNTGSYGQVAYNSPSPNSPQPITVTTDGQALTGINAAMDAGATIAGTVTSSTGKRLAGICAGAGSPAASGGASTNGKGQYQIPNLQPGQYQVVFSPGCGTRQQNKAEQSLAGAYFGSQANPPLVSAAVGTTAGINGTLQVGGSIAGKVNTKSGRTVEETCVAYTGVSGPAAVYGTGVGQAFNGAYKLTGLLPGSYTIAFLPTCDGFSSNDQNQWYKDRPSPTGAARVKVTAGRTTSGISGALIKGGSIAGTISYAGKPVRGMCVFAQNVTQFLDSGASETGRTGTYMIRGLNSGRYELELYPCDNGSQTLAGTLLTRIVRVAAPKVTSGVNATAQLGGTLAGKVLGDTPTVAQAGICVDALDATGAIGSSAITGNDGTFSISSLPAGQYYIYYNDTSCTQGSTDLAPQWYPHAATEQAASTVTVSAGDVTTMPDVTLSTNGAIAGTVTATGHGPLAGACVIVTASTPGSEPVLAVTRDSGAYSVVGLAPGSYEVEFSSGCGASGYKPQWWHGKNSPGAVNLVPVTAGTTTMGISAALHK